MVTIPEAGEPGLQSLLDALTSQSTSADSRVDAYLTFTDRLKDDGKTIFHDALVVRISEFAPVAAEDIINDADELSQAALYALGFCIHNADITKGLSEEQSLQIVRNLCSVIKKTTDKTTCTRALWCLSKQKLPEKVVKDELHTILCTIEHALCSNAVNSNTVDHEAINVISSLLEHLPDDMEKHTLKWAKLVYPLLIHAMARVRERALVAMGLGLPAMLRYNDAISKSLVVDMKALIIPEMSKFMATRNEIFIMTIWGHFVQILGKALHHGNFINRLLPLAEQAFKTTAPEVKCAAFRAWGHLIDNFALDSDIINNPKRVKLLMQVFKINNAKTEEVAAVKLQVWWQYLKCLGKNLPSHFDQVVSPLLHFCVGGGSISNFAFLPTTPVAKSLITQKLGSPATPHFSMSHISSPGPSVQVYKSIELKGCEVIAHILGGPWEEHGPQEVTLTVDSLPVKFIPSPAFFLKHADVLIHTVKGCLVNCGSEIQECLLDYIWSALIGHLKDVLGMSNRQEISEAFSIFLSAFEDIVESGSVEYKKIMNLFEAVCSLPAKSLASSGYHIGNAEDMNSCPALFLTEILLRNSLLQMSVNQERHIAVLQSLVASTMSNSPAKLALCKSVFQLIDKSAEMLQNKEWLWRIWSSCAQLLFDFILKESEVNQGDVLEPNFSCIYTALLLPAQHLFTYALPQPSLRTLLKTWGDIYKLFARLVALVLNAEANIWCEDMCSAIIRTCSENIKDLQLDAFCQICVIIVDTLDFSAFSNTFNINQTSPLSPSKFIRKKHVPLGNLHSFIKLVSMLLTAIVEVSDVAEKVGHMGHVQFAASNVISVITSLFNHLTQPSMISAAVAKLAKPLSTLYEISAKKLTNKLCTAQFVQKLEKLWLDISTCLQGRYTGFYDSGFLEHLSPLLEQNFLHPRRAIKNQTVLLWSATFSHSQHPLRYPDTLKPVLAKVKEKTTISLPGWEGSEIAVVEDTPISQISQVESDVPVPDIVSFSSPQKKFVGSFLNKAMSPAAKFSPKALINSPAGKSPARSSPLKSARRKLGPSIHDMRNEEFVVIAPSPRKRKVLTEHQKEVLREKKSLPAMYSTLDASQDVSLMAHFMTDTQMENSMTSTPEILPYRPFSFQATKKQKLSDGTSNVTEVLKEKVVQTEGENKGVENGENQKESETMKQGRLVRFSTDAPRIDGSTAALKENLTSSTLANLDKASSEKCENATVVSENRDKMENNNNNTKVTDFKGLFKSQQTESNKISESVGADSEESSVEPSQAATLEASPAQNTPPQVETLFIRSPKQLNLTKVSSPRRCSSTTRLEAASSPRLRSQSPSKTRRSKSLNSRSAGHGNKQTTVPNIEKWVLRSPKSHKSPPASVTLIEETQTSPVATDKNPATLVEETLSPWKSNKLTSAFSKNLNSSIQETPEKNNSVSIPVESATQKARNLFQEEEETCDAVPPSPNSKSSESSVLSVRHALLSRVFTQPMIKVHKLTSEEILQYSQSSQESKGENAIQRDSESSEHPGLGADAETDITSPSASSHSKVDITNQSSTSALYEGDDDSEVIFCSQNISNSETPSSKETRESDVILLDSEEPADDVWGKEAEDVHDDNSDDVSQTILSKPASKLPKKSHPATKKPSRRISQHGKDEVGTSSCSENLPNYVEETSRKSENGDSNDRAESEKNEEFDSNVEVVSWEDFINSTFPEKTNSDKQTSEEDAIVSSSTDNKTADVTASCSSSKPEAEHMDNLTSSEKKPKDNASSQDSKELSTPSEKVLRKRGRPRKSVTSGDVTIMSPVIESKESAENGSSKGVSMDTESVENGRKNVKLDCEEDLPLESLRGKSSDPVIIEQKDSLRPCEEQMECDDVPAEPVDESQREEKEDSGALEDSQSDSQIHTPNTQRNRKKTKSKVSRELDHLRIDMNNTPSPLRLRSDKTPKSYRRRSFDSLEKKRERNPTPKRRSLSLKPRDALPEIPEMEAMTCEPNTGDDDERLEVNKPSNENVETLEPPKESESEITETLNVSPCHLSENVITDTAEETDEQVAKEQVDLTEKSAEIDSENSKDKEDNTNAKCEKPSEEKEGEVTVAKNDSELGDSSESKVKNVNTELVSEKGAATLKEKEATQSSAHLKSSPKKNAPSPHIETPKSSTKHQSRGMLLLERARKIVTATKPSPSKGSNNARPNENTTDTTQSPKAKPPASILKCSQNDSTSKSSVTSSPVSIRQGGESPSTFHPIRVTRAFSPAASPSAGILKRRRLSESVVKDSPSPPNKQRRVSFAESVEYNTPPGGSPRPVNRCLELPKQSAPMSPLVTTTPSRVTSSNSKFVTTPSQSESCRVSPSDKEMSGFAVPQGVAKRSQSQLSVLEDSCVSTQESQLNATDPVCPRLMSCDSPVEQILPQLTSSTWTRGLGQFVRSRNIRTVGNLCSLSEYDIHNLPIRSPKVQVVRKALDNFEKQQQKLKAKLPSSEQKTTEEATEKVTPVTTTDSSPVKVDEVEVMDASPEKQSLPFVEDELEKLFPSKDLDTSIEVVADVPLFDSCELQLSQESEDYGEKEDGNEEPNKPDLESDDAVFEIGLTQPFKPLENNDMVVSQSGSTTENVEQTQEIVKISEPQPEAALATAETSGGERENNSAHASAEEESSSSSKDGELLSTRRSVQELLSHLAPELTPENLEGLPSEEIFSIHQRLSGYLGTVLTALQSKVQSSIDTKKKHLNGQ